MKNKPLRIVKAPIVSRLGSQNYGVVLAQLAIAESNLVKAGIHSAMPHFIAIVKELERYYGFCFKQIEENHET